MICDVSRLSPISNEIGFGVVICPKEFFYFSIKKWHEAFIFF
ncbi:hypothetical protein LEP1GSC036_0734 [Leptospira weilii str. 2006001853]|uniref:Uncharacterized protein n=2 Tax=Leptospira weilii TaxID=28184 RepID=A0A828Z3V6_9LEPT|nr:hypothetical protein LEP1GSC036_0734 [Leptospira weilii str. 2006001853]EMM74971.1 hypothetical protein LEP1GSC038_0884 [Leptospira weilii str. 2006001855]